MISTEQWHRYDEQGFLALGPLLSDEQLSALRTRADDLALGRVVNPAVQMQLDTGGRYEDLPEAVEQFDDGTLRYRKIQGLEHDDLYAGLLAHPLVRATTARAYGPHAPVSLFRAMVMNKPAGQGTVLPWHQDGGDVWSLDRDPLVTVWVALDDATAANGCVQVVPGTHQLGLLTREGSNITAEAAARHCPPERVHDLEVPAGHGVLIHNWLLHRSGVNPTPGPRRAFTTCLMDGRTRSTLTGRHFPLLDSAPPTPHPYLEALEAERDHHRTSAEQAEQYALSLLADNRRLTASLAAATEYAADLEQRLAATGPDSRPAPALAGLARSAGRRAAARLRPR